MSEDKDSAEFRERMDLFFRCSPLMPKPTRCDDCAEFDIIADDLVYCVTCHHPIAGEKIQINSANKESKRSILSILLGR